MKNIIKWVLILFIVACCVFIVLQVDKNTDQEKKVNEVSKNGTQDKNIINESGLEKVNIEKDKEPVVQQEKNTAKVAEKKAESEEITKPEENVQQVDNRIIELYYFHGTRRCHTCKTIEEYAAEIIKTRYSIELNENKLLWKTVNVDLPENEHFINTFELHSSTMVLVEKSGNNITKWVALPKVWTLVRNRNAFEEYLVNEIGAFLRG
ncbi:MAG: hypothetical protein JW737_00490 [Acidobacteria bacterium]|nr:hypothetical protein [Acidobacteriota bacterium]